MSVRRRRMWLATAAALALTAPLVASQGLASASPDVQASGSGVAAEPPIKLTSPTRVVVQRYGKYVYGGIGLRVEAVGEPFELWSKRASYSQPITTQWRSSRGNVTIPGAMKSWTHLNGFLRLTVTKRNGTPVKKMYPRVCLASGSTFRVKPSAPARSPYPWNCPYNPLTKGSVQGIQEGWGVDALGEYAPLNLAVGTYRVTGNIREPFASKLGIPASATRTYTLVVKKGSEDGWRRARAGDPTVQPEPAAEPPTKKSSGTQEGPKPDLQSLPAFGMEVSRGGNHLRFSANVWNAGRSPLVVDGFRRDGEDVMDAYQYFFDADGNQTGYEHVGEMEWHAANHNHWHFHDFARYRLLKADKTQAVRSKKESFCLANTDAVDYTVDGADWQPEGTDLGSACGGLESLSLRQVLSPGSGDTYQQFRAGQSFNLKGLPNGRYYVAVEANPTGHLTESDTTNNVALRKIWIGGKPGNRRVNVPPIGLIDDH